MADSACVFKRFIPKQLSGNLRSISSGKFVLCLAICVPLSLFGGQVCQAQVQTSQLPSQIPNQASTQASINQANRNQANRNQGLQVLLQTLGDPNQAWIKQTEQAIEQHRKVPVQVIVLDANGQVVPNATLSIKQQSHDFAIGVTPHFVPYALGPQEIGPSSQSLDEQNKQVIALQDSSLDEPVMLSWFGSKFNQPLWRILNHVSLDALTCYRDLKPDQRDWSNDSLERLDKWIQGAHSAGIGLRWGSFLYGDPALNPDWLMAIDPQERQLQVLDDLAWLCRHYGVGFESMDVLDGRLRYQDWQDEFGWMGLRRLYDAVGVYQPRMSRSVCYHRQLQGAGSSHVLDDLRQLEQAFVDFDLISVRLKTQGIIVPTALLRDVERIEQVDVPIEVVDLKIAGHSSQAVAYNLQVLMRVLFAQPAVRGIWFGGITPEDSWTPEAALVNKDGQLTLPGQTLDALFHDHWRDDIQTLTSNKGTWSGRLFWGEHIFEVTLPDGQVIQTRKRFEKNRDQDDADSIQLTRYVVLEPDLKK